MTDTPQILCIGSVLWDIIGRSTRHMRVGSDVPGRITRLPGGVAMNIAMTLRRFGLAPALISAVGRDAQGDELVQAATAMGLVTQYLYRSDDLPTDVYMAIEGSNGLVAAIADAHSLEAAGDKILAPMRDGRLGRDDAPFQGTVALDGNLTTTLLAQIAQDPAFAAADLRIAPASPGKADRLRPLLARPATTLYVNKEEANLLLNQSLPTARAAAQALVDQGAHRVLVTDGDLPAADANASGVIDLAPPSVFVTRVTGAGDTFMAAHIQGEMTGLAREDAFARALQTAAAYVSGETE